MGKAFDCSSKADGYLENLQIKIPMSEKTHNMEDMLTNIVLQIPVDDFVLSMDRAAETAFHKLKIFS